VSRTGFEGKAVDDPLFLLFLEEGSRLGTIRENPPDEERDEDWD